MSATPDSTLADSSRTIADLRRKLAECEAERDAALAREAATTQVLGVINRSPGDLAPVFDAMLERAMHLCGAAFGVFAIYDEEHYQVVATHGVPLELADFVRRAVRIHPGSMPDRLRRGENTIQVPDITALGSELRTPGLVAMIELGKARTAVWVALRKDGVAQGFIGVYRQDVRPFSDKQIALLQNFAAQAVIAMENARLITETREALEQQTATAEVLQIINSSPGDLAPVFDTMLDKAIHLCGAAFGTLWTYDGEHFQSVALHRVPQAFADFLTRQPFPIEPGSAHERLINGEPIVQFEDVAAQPLIGPARRALVTGGGARTLIAVPLRKDDRLVGAITAFRQEVRPFTDKQIALLQNFAEQAVIAMENARLLTETREALEQQTATAEVLQVINSSPGDLTPVFDAILEKAHSLCNSDHGTLFLRDGSHFRPAAIRGVPEPIAERLREGLGADAPVVRPLLAGEHFAHILDIAQLDHPLAQLSSEAGVHALLSVPLRKGDELFGMFVTARFEAGAFSEKQIALLQNFAAQAVIAMENARLLTETREALEQQTATAEVLQVINSSPGDLAPVFEAMLEKATRLCEAPFGILRTWDGERFHFGAVHGEPTFRDWVRQRGPTRPDRDASPLGRIVAGERVVRFADEPGDEGYWNSAGFREMVEASGIRRGIWVALRKDDELLGTITVYRREARPFSNKQIALLDNFAAQAVIAMENARLLGELRQRTDEVAELNRGLEARVAEQVEELGRVGRLKRFLAPQLAEMIVSQGDEKILESHRREIVVVFCDLRGYTAFTETAEPEEVLDFLREYHGTLGPLVSQFEGTLDQFSGDGIMVFFNDPVPCPDPAERAVNMAIAMREVAGKLITAWRRHGCELGFGAGIAQGYATLGQIGFSERSGYTAIGTVCNLAARLCAEAKDGQILVSSRIAEAVEAVATLEDLGNLELKGLRRPVAAFNVTELISGAPARA